MEVSRDIENASDSSGRVDEKSSDFYPRALEFSLEQVVHHAWCHANVVKEIADADLDDIRNDEVVAFGDRLQYPAIKLPVEIEDLGIQRFPRVIFLDRRFTGLGKRIEWLVERSFVDWLS